MPAVSRHGRSPARGERGNSHTKRGRSKKKTHTHKKPHDNIAMAIDEPTAENEPYLERRWTPRCAGRCFDARPATLGKFLYLKTSTVGVFSSRTVARARPTCITEWPSHMQPWTAGSKQTSRSPWPPHGRPLQAHTRTWDEMHVSLRRPALNARRFTLVSGAACLHRPLPRQQTRRGQGPGDSDRNKTVTQRSHGNHITDDNGKRGTILGGMEQKSERLGVARSTGSFWWPILSFPSAHTLSRQHP